MRPILLGWRMSDYTTGFSSGSSFSILISGRLGRSEGESWSHDKTNHRQFALMLLLFKELMTLTPQSTVVLGWINTPPNVYGSP